MGEDGTTGVRGDGRRGDEIRPITIETPFLDHAEGSASIRMGRTWVVCAATVEERQPPWLKGTNRGWVTAEYGMLPRAVSRRRNREPGSRGLEIQRLVGRTLRAVVDLRGLPLHTLTLDCDVMNADGGTRTAAVTGAFVALCQACRWMASEGRILKIPIQDQVAGLGIGLVGGRVLSDLCYAEDSEAAVDTNLFMTASGQFVGIHASAEMSPFGADDLENFVQVAWPGFEQLFAAQREALGLPPDQPFRAAALIDERETP